MSGTFIPITSPIMPVIMEARMPASTKRTIASPFLNRLSDSMPLSRFILLTAKTAMISDKSPMAAASSHGEINISFVFLKKGFFIFLSHKRIHQIVLIGC